MSLIPIKNFLFSAQDELKLAVKQGNTLLSCIKDQAIKSENHILNPDEIENQTTVERCVTRLHTRGKDCLIHKQLFYRLFNPDKKQLNKITTYYQINQESKGSKKSI